jgi:hypothetical protein
LLVDIISQDASGIGGALQGSILSDQPSWDLT